MAVCLLCVCVCMLCVSDAVEAHSCVDTDSEISLDKQYTTVDIIQWQDISTQRCLSCFPSVYSCCLFSKEMDVW